MVSSSSAVPSKSEPSGLNKNGPSGPNKNESDESCPQLKPTTREYLALIATSLLQFGDAVEMYIPVVITQPVSCDLALTSDMEHTLALALYTALALDIPIAVPFSNRFGRRAVLLTAIYLALASTVACAIVPNYHTLLISRMLLGISIALNISTVSVYMSEICKSEGFFIFALTINSVCFTVGGGWSGLLGYLLLHKLGWRYFVVVSSTPLFLPPLVLFQFYLPDSKNKEGGKEKEYTGEEDEEVGLLAPLTASAVSIEDTEAISDHYHDSTGHDHGNSEAPGRHIPGAVVARRVAKLVAISISVGVVYFGAMLLVPAVSRTQNLTSGLVTGCGAIYGTQFLTITLLFGVAHVAGRSLSYIGQRLSSSSAIVMVTCSAVGLAGTGAAYTLHATYYPLLGALGLVQIAYAAAILQSYILLNDQKFVSARYLAVASAIGASSAYAALAVGNLLSEVVVEAGTVTAVHVVFSGLALLVSFTFFNEEEGWASRKS